MLRSYQSGQVEIVRVSRCYYDDDVAEFPICSASFCKSFNDRLKLYYMERYYSSPGSL